MINMRENISLRICSLAKQLLFFLDRYPSFTSGYIKRCLDKTATKQDAEVDQYWSNCADRNRGHVALLVFIYISYCLKNAVVPYQASKLFDYQNPEENIHLEYVLAMNPQTTSVEEQTVRSFACLATNCTRFASNESGLTTSLAEDASKLPLFTLCHPNLDAFYAPAAKLDTFSILAFSASGFNVLLLGAWLPVQQLIFPAQDLMMMFIVAPEVTRRLMRARARELVLDLAVSLYNFRHVSLCMHSASLGALIFDNDALEGPLKDLSAHPINSPHLHPILESQPGTLDATYSGRLRPLQIHLRSGLKNALKRDEIDADTKLNFIAKQSSLRGKTRGQFELLIDGCMPIVRTKWWRDRIARFFCYSLIFSMSAVFYIGSLALAYIQYRVWKKEELLREYADNIRQSKCAIWLKTASNHTEEQPQSIVLVDQLGLNWNWYTMMETIILNFTPAFSMAAMFAYLLTLICEMAIWLAELRLYIVASLVFARFRLHGDHRSRCPFSIAYGSTDANGEQLLSTGRLREKLMLESKFSFIWLHSAIEHQARNGSTKIVYNFINSRQNDRVHTKWFVDEIMNGTSNNTKQPIADIEEWSDDQNSFAANIESLEQFYVNFRLFVEHVRNYTPSIAFLLIITYLLNYGLVLIAVLCSRNIANFTVEPLFLMIFGLSIANLLIFLAANFHANVSILIKERSMIFP